MRNNIPISRGYYEFASGYVAWYSGLSASEKKREIAKYGAIVKFVHTS